MKEKAGAELQSDLHYVFMIVNRLKSDVTRLKELFESQEKELEDAESKCRG